MTESPASRVACAPPDAWERLLSGAASLGVSLSQEQLRSLDRYLQLLCEWNRRFNLTAIDQPEEILVKHFLDSLTVATAVDLRGASRLVDVGAGAGLPGLVLKIAFPHLRVTLIESVAKKVRFIERAAADLGLAETVALHVRAEDAGRGALREDADVVTARAVARINVLAEWLLPLAHVGGEVVAMKGPDVREEVEEAQAAIRRLGGAPPEVCRFCLPGNEIGRSLVVFRKVKRTPPEFPRCTGAARKAPL